MPAGSDPPPQLFAFALGIALALTAFAMLSYAFRQDRRYY